jgi:hypothetical protein
MSATKRPFIRRLLALYARVLPFAFLAFLVFQFALVRFERLRDLFRFVLRGHVVFWDFQLYYTAGYLARVRLGSQIYDLVSMSDWIERLTGNPAESGRYNYPPFVALAFSPLSWLSYTTAFQWWFGINGAALLLLGLALWRLAAPAPAWQRTLLLIATVLSDATYYVMGAGQVSSFVVLALAAALLLLRRGRDGTAGAVLSLAVIKPQLVAGVLLLLVLRARWRALLAFVATMGALSLAGLAVLGPKTHMEMLQFLASQSGAGGVADINYTHMHNWRAFLATFGLDSNGLLYAGTFLLVSAASTFGGVWAWRAGPAGGDGRDNQEWAVALLLPLLFTPHLWTQDLLVLSLVGALALSQFARARIDHGRQFTTTAVILASYVILSEAWSLTRHDISLTVLPLLAAFVWACARPWGPSQSPNPPRPGESRQRPIGVPALAGIHRPHR